MVELFESEKEQKEGKRRRAFPDLTVVYFFKPDEDEKTVNLICRDFEDPLVLDSRDWIEKCFPCIFKGIPPVCGLRARMFVCACAFVHVYVLATLSIAYPLLNMMLCCARFHAAVTPDCGADVQGSSCDHDIWQYVACTALRFACFALFVSYNALISLLQSGHLKCTNSLQLVGTRLRLAWIACVWA